MVIKSNRLNNTEILKYGVIIIFIAIAMTTWKYIQITKEHNWFLIDVNIGLLAFIALFYAFIISKDMKEKRKNLVFQQIEAVFSKLSNHMNKISSEKENKNPNYIKISNSIHKSAEYIESIEKYVNDSDIKDKILMACTAYITSILFFIIDKISDESFFLYSETFPIRIYAYFLLLYAMYKTFDTIRTWNMLTSSRISEY